jgi:predicted membrane protein
VDGYRRRLCWTTKCEVALNESWLLWGLLFGSFGLGFFVYGKKQRAVVPLVCGLALMIFPYFISNTILLVGIGVMLIVVPYFVRI